MIDNIYDLEKPTLDSELVRKLWYVRRHCRRVSIRNWPGRSAEGWRSKTADLMKSIQASMEF